MDSKEKENINEEELKSTRLFEDETVKRQQRKKKKLP